MKKGRRKGNKFFIFFFTILRINNKNEKTSLLFILPYKTIRSVFTYQERKKQTKKRREKQKKLSFLLLKNQESKVTFKKEKEKMATAKEDKKKKQETTATPSVPYLFDGCSFTVQEFQRLAKKDELQYRYDNYIPIDKVSSDDVLRHADMTSFQELICILFMLFGIPNGAFSIPITLYIIGRYVVGNVPYTYGVAAMVLIPLAIIPQRFIPSTHQSWISVHVVKYFSYRQISEEIHPPYEKNDEKFHPRIYVAPPHGVFPYGNVLAILSWSSYCGVWFRGLTASSALRVPIFKQIMRSIGCIDASRHIARKALEDGEHIGISTGGVAEVFESNEDDECIVLRQRKGLIKLAIRTGADLVPSYLFGNTKLLSCWGGEGIPGGRNFLETLSRRVGFALIIIYGRFGLPIPRRVPILGVTGKAIPTHHIQCEEPTIEQVDMIQKQLLDAMVDIFDRYKGLYGWESKKLIIK